MGLYGQKKGTNTGCACVPKDGEDLTQSRVSSPLHHQSLEGDKSSIHYLQSMSKKPRCEWSTNEGTVSLNLEEGDKKALLLIASSYSLVPRGTWILMKVLIWSSCHYIKVDQVKKKKVLCLNILAIVACAYNPSTWVAIGTLEASF